MTTTTTTMTAEATAPARTYGMYQYVEQDTSLGGTRKAAWVVRAEPAVHMRLKRTFGRVRADVRGNLIIGHTQEVARDLEWFCARFPLEPVDVASHLRLTTAAAEHRAREAAVVQIARGERRPTLPMPPLKTPRDYQLAAVEQLRLMNGLLLTDEVGLGKTFTGALTFLYDDALPAVVVPPTHLPPRWLDELRDSMPWLNVAVAKKGRPYDLRPRKEGPEPDVYVIPYTRLAGWAEHLVQEVGVKTIVFDEVQDLRGGQGTNKGVAAKRIADACTFRLGLTATPIYNYAGEIHSIMEFLNPGVLGSRDEFIREWGARAWNGHVQVKDPAALGSYLREQGVMLGRTRTEVGRELPRTIKTTVEVEHDAKVVDAAAADLRRFAELLLSSGGTREERGLAATQIDMRMRQATGVAKAPYVAEFVRLLLESEEKVVLFGWHRDVYDIWNARLAAYDPVMYTGSESPTQKQASLQRFYDDPSCRVLIMSLRSGAGTDGIQKVSRTAVFGELDWSPQVHEQAIGRVRRDGMGDEPPAAYYLVSDGGSDPAVAEVLQVKRQQGEQVVSPDGKLLNTADVDVDRTRRLAEQVLAGRKTA